MRISNDLYSSGTVSSVELSHGFTRLTTQKSKPLPLYEYLIYAHHELVSLRKLTCIILSHSIQPNRIFPLELVQVYVRPIKEERRTCLSPRQVIAVYLEAGMISVPGLSGKTVNSALEDTRAVFPVADLTAQIQDTFDALDTGLESLQ